MRFRLRFYFILFDTFFRYDIFLLHLDRISQFLSQITCPELDLYVCVCDYNQTINVDEMNTTTPAPSPTTIYCNTKNA